MYEPHEAFEAPGTEAILWRYMDFTKFVSLIAREALFFARADELDDSFEGSLTPANVEQREELLRYVRDPKSELPFLSSWWELVQKMPGATFINCWHRNEFESHAMWKLYAREKDGIAIMTTFAGLRDGLTCQEPVHIGMVKYIDYKTDMIPDGELLSPFLYKRKSFEHEQEVRAAHMGKLPSFLKQDDTYPVGKYLSVDLERLIKRIVVAPFAPDWFLELVHSVTVRFGVDTSTISRSALDEKPLFYSKLGDD